MRWVLTLLPLILLLGTRDHRALAVPERAEDVLAQIRTAQEDFQLERYYTLARRFLKSYPSHERADAVRAELALQLVAENISTPKNGAAQEARALLAEQEQKAKSVDQRFEAALVLLKFSNERDAQKLITQAERVLSRYPDVPERREVHAFLIERLSELGEPGRAAERVKRYMAEYPSADSEMYRALIARAGLVGQPLPLSQQERAGMATPLEGKVVIVDFWATWCRPCLESRPALNAFAARHKKAGLLVIEASIDDDEPAWRAYLAAHPSPHPQILASKTGLADRAGVTEIPCYLLADRDGRIVSTELRGDALFKKAESLLKTRR